MFETEVIVIDPENEYQHMAEAVGGRYFNIFFKFRPPHKSFRTAHLADKMRLRQPF